MGKEDVSDELLTEELGGFQHEKGEFFVKVVVRFEAAHFLYRYFEDGSDEPLHGHSWKVELFLARIDGLTADNGISVDFLAFSQRLKQLVGRLEHACLNNLPEFKEVNPTAENLARWFYSGLKQSLEQNEAIVRKIMVYEGRDNCAVFIPYRWIEIDQEID